jgi:hypothetical protein
MSCNTLQIEDNNDAPQGKCLLESHIESHEPQTRTELSFDFSTVVWKPGDAFTLLSSGGEKAMFSVVGGIGSASGTFSGDVIGEAPYTAFYPASGNASIADNALSFNLPEIQRYVHNSFGAGASPMVASVADISAPLQFKNLCGVLCLKLTSKPSVKVSQIVITDLGGKMLWGNCALELDGTEGTADQKLTITGGSSEITLRMDTPIDILESEPGRFYVVVPPGAFADGFSVTVYNENGERVNTFKTLNPEARVSRSTITNMARYDIRTEPANPGKRGFYKDLFMDSGIRLNTFTNRPAFSYIGWDFEYYAAPFYSANAKEDIALQNKVFVSAEDDENGYLLYPDRQPRFRCIFVNGGDNLVHGESLGADGRKSMYDFVYNGGSYVGTCAGAFLACKYRQQIVSPETRNVGIYPGRIISTGITADTYTDLAMEHDSPLKNYYSLGGTVAKVRHHNGGYMSEAAKDLIPGTEVLLRYSNCPEGHESVNGKVAIWAYKPSTEAGRMVLCGSHPEKAPDGEIRDLFSAMLLYAADGNGTPPVKANLSNGLRYRCESMSSENNPAHARIGDKQYHHFTVDIPEGAKNLVIQLKSEWKEDDLFLSLNKGDYAWTSEADYVQDDDGSNKTLKVRRPEAGTWYISVYSPNTVTATAVSYQSTEKPDKYGYYFKYTGNTHLLNGIPYSIKVDWE